MITTEENIWARELLASTQPKIKATTNKVILLGIIRRLGFQAFTSVDIFHQVGELGLNIAKPNTQRMVEELEEVNILLLLPTSVAGKQYIINPIAISPLSSFGVSQVRVILEKENKKAKGKDVKMKAHYLPGILSKKEEEALTEAFQVNKEQLFFVARDKKEEVGKASRNSTTKQAIKALFERYPGKALNARQVYEEFPKVLPNIDKSYNEVYLIMQRMAEKEELYQVPSLDSKERFVLPGTFENATLLVLDESEGGLNEQGELKVSRLNVDLDLDLDWIRIQKRIQEKSGSEALSYHLFAYY